MHSIQSSKLQHKLAWRLAKMAVRALYFEVKAYPKPGLVSFVDAGAHSDMNGITFYRGLFALRHYFYNLVYVGLMHDDFGRLKQLAIHAEERMLVATLGVNTHRGAIFALGQFCVSAARLVYKRSQLTQDSLHQQLLADWSAHLTTHVGNRIRANHRVMDAKSVALTGYLPVFQVFDEFRALLKESNSLDTACLFAYLKLLLQLEDTNILDRKGVDVLIYAKACAAELLSISCLATRQHSAVQLHMVFSRQGISPGGVADLIGVLLFMDQLFCESELCHG